MSSKIAIEGPGQWRTMHYAGFHGKDNIDSTIDSLSCNDCKNHCKNILPRLRTMYGSDPFRLGVELHNAVNEKLGRRKFTVREAKEALGIDVTRPSGNRRQGALQPLGCKNCGKKRSGILRRIS